MLPIPFSKYFRKFMKNVADLYEIHPGSTVAAFCGLGIKECWRSISPAGKSHILEFLDNHWVEIAIVGGTLSIAAAIYSSDNYIRTTSYTKRERYMTYTWGDSINFGSEESDRFMKSKPDLFSTYHDLYVKVTRLFQIIIRANYDMPETQELEWKIFVIKSKKECFSFPNGWIFITTRMINLCANDDQLAFLIAREIGHCILQHKTELACMNNLANCGCNSFALTIWTLVPDLKVAAIAYGLYSALMLIFIRLPHSRMLELEADAIGLFMTAKSCFHVKRYYKFWNNLATSDAQNRWFPAVEWLSSRPSYESHINILNTKMLKALELRPSPAGH